MIHNRIYSLVCIITFSCLFQAHLYGQKTVDTYADNSLGDIIAMYYGQKVRLSWNVQQVSCAVTHTFADGHTEWMFPTFLYLEFRRGNKLLGNGHPVAKEPSLQEDWQWLINRFFAKDEGLDALDQAIEQAKRKLGPPPFKHQVILTIPVPVLNQGYWGKINGKEINFNKENDRFNAVKWYIDNIESRFRQQGYKNITIAGYHWLDEYAAPSKSYMPRVGQYLHQLGRKFIWCPMSRADYRFEWKSLGVDFAFLQIGHFWNMKSSTKGIAAQANKAKTYGLGLMFEINESITKDHDKYYPRMVELIDVFEQQNVFNNSGIVYYFSNNALYDLHRSTRSDDKAVMDRLAHLIANRNNRWLSKNRATKQQSYPEQSSTTNPNNRSNRDKLDWRDPEYWHF